MTADQIPALLTRGIARDDGARLSSRTVSDRRDQMATALNEGVTSVGEDYVPGSSGFDGAPLMRREIKGASGYS